MSSGTSLMGNGLSGGWLVAAQITPG